MFCMALYNVAEVGRSTTSEKGATGCRQTAGCDLEVARVDVDNPLAGADSARSGLDLLRAGPQPMVPHIRVSAAAIYR